MEQQDNTVKISVVTVCFNSEKTLEQTIQSVINQSYKNVEYIIIDGGSTDGTLDIIKKYEHYISYWVSEPDKGTYDAMNKGIRQASGDLVAFLNSDDWYSMDALQRVAMKYKRTNADILYGDLSVVGDDGTQKILYSRANVDFNAIFYSTVVDHPCAFVKTSILKQRPFNTKYIIAADYDMFNEFHLRNYKFEYVDNGYIANFRLGGYSTTAIIECKKEAYNIGKKYLRYYKNEEWYPKVKGILRQNRLLIFLMQIQGKLDEKYRNKIKRVFGAHKIDKVYIFGAGEVGLYLGMILLSIGLSFCFVDNNVGIQGTEKLNKPVLVPDSIVPSAGSVVLIANSGNTEAMKRQLCRIGFEQNKTFFDFRDWCMYLLYLKYNKV